ncbi:MAG: DinB family protein [Acidobacteria bacterium]|nr:DinB family protein [Acidobacteriota bacterium]MBI3656685.1 DinB family protein [Acidobacteriota bacterium]
MTLAEVKRHFAYNSWANELVFEVLKRLSVEPYLQDLKGSHGGIHGTITHMIGVQVVWLSRWRGTPDAALLKAEDVRSLSEVQEVWKKVDAETTLFLNTLSDAKLQETITVRTGDGRVFTNSYAEMMRHLINHSSYHRGQIATMLRQLGYKPAGTDLITFYRQQTQG